MTTAKKIARILLMGVSFVLVWVSTGCRALSNLCENGARSLE